MAKRHPEPVPKLKAKLTKKNPDFYRIIGQRGGKATTKNHKDTYFSRLAMISHARRKAQSEAESLPPKSDSAK